MHQDTMLEEYNVRKIHT